VFANNVWNMQLPPPESSVNEFRMKQSLGNGIFQHKVQDDCNLFALFFPNMPVTLLDYLSSARILTNNFPS
jgi:hypothetical protein